MFFFFLWHSNVNLLVSVMIVFRSSIFLHFLEEKGGRNISRGLDQFLQP